MTTPLPAEWDSWVDELGRLLATPSLRRSEVSTRGHLDKKFALGDFLATAPSQWIDRLAEALGEEPSTFRVYREVAEKIPPHQRVAAAWTVHRDLRERPELLTPGLTVRKAAELLGKRPIDSKATHRQTVGDKADLVRELLADPDVAAVIESERHMSAEERRARRAARSFTSEMQAKAKDLENELKEARQAKSAYEATVKALLDMHKAAQLADGIGEMAGDLEQPERLAAALRTLITSATTALENFETVDGREITVIEGQVWQVRPEAYGQAESAQRSLPSMGRVVDHNG